MRNERCLRLCSPFPLRRHRGDRSSLTFPGQKQAAISYSVLRTRRVIMQVYIRSSGAKSIRSSPRGGAAGTTATGKLCSLDQAKVPTPNCAHLPRYLPGPRQVEFWTLSPPKNKLEGGSNLERASCTYSVSRAMDGRRLSLDRRRRLGLQISSLRRHPLRRRERPDVGGTLGRPAPPPSRVSPLNRKLMG